MEILRNKKEIMDWLKQHQIEKFHLVKDKDKQYFVNVEGDVNLSRKGLKFIPVRFNTVNGSFNCEDNDLTSLEGSPWYVKKDFYCHRNRLVSLKGAPKSIFGSFSCAQNNLLSLIDSPERVRLNYDCALNEITSLNGAPKKVRDFDCSSNNLKSLEYCPTNITGKLIFGNNDIENLEFFPREVRFLVRAENNELLGDLQFSHNFQDFYQEHLRLRKILDLKNNLEEKIDISQVKNIKHKI